jgi:hypothetical protein
MYDILYWGSTFGAAKRVLEWKLRIEGTHFHLGSQQHLGAIGLLSVLKQFGLTNTNLI